MSWKAIVGYLVLIAGALLFEAHVRQQRQAKNASAATPLTRAEREEITAVARSKGHVPAVKRLRQLRPSLGLVEANDQVKAMTQGETKSS